MHETKTETRLPDPTSTETFAVKNPSTGKEQTYEILRYAGGGGPKLALIKGVATKISRKSIPTVEEATRVLRGMLKPGEWAYVGDSELEENAMAYRVGVDNSGRWYDGIVLPSHAAPVVIFRHTDNQAGALRNELDLAVKIRW